MAGLDELLAVSKDIADPRKHEAAFRAADPDQLAVLLARLSLNEGAAANLRWVLGELRDDPPEDLERTALAITLAIVRRSFGAAMQAAVGGDLEAFARRWDPQDPFSESCLLEAVRKRAARGEPVPEWYDGRIHGKAIGRTSFAGLPVLVAALRYLPRERARALLEREIGLGSAGALCAVHALDDEPDLARRALEQLAAHPDGFASPRTLGMVCRGLELLGPEHDEAVADVAARVRAAGASPSLAAAVDKAVARRARAARRRAPASGRRGAR